MITLIHSFEDDAESVLQAMTLSGETLREICRRGLAEYRTATPFHPANAAGTLMYNEMVHAMRLLLVPSGWDYVEEGLCYTFNRELSIALVVTSGDASVGDATLNPSFKYPKGPTTHAAIAGNARQLGLFDEFPDLAAFVLPSTAKDIDFNTYKIWWLLHHVDPTGEVRAELSLPIGVGNRSETNQWESRIILEPIPFDEEPDTESVGDGPDTPDVDVPVRKKA